MASTSALSSVILPSMPTSPEPADPLLTINRKALLINLEETRYGTFAEIGAGQEVARHFFQAGGAAGTIAKTMSAYDMAFSDAIYGKARRFVSRERLVTMLAHEYGLLRERLVETRGAGSRFFVFANTVAAQSYRGNKECHGWLGVRFQTEPGREPCEILAHVRMWDKENIAQQHAIGVFGVNLLYAAFFLRESAREFVLSLVDHVGAERIEVDVLHFSGPELAHLENRAMALALVEHGLTNGALFAPGGTTVLPSEAFYKKPVLVQRGSFNPVTCANTDLMECAMRKFSREPSVERKSALPLFEISLTKLRKSEDASANILLDRIDTLGAIGAHVLISSFQHYFRLTAYFRRYTSEMIGYAMGARALLALLDESHYEQLDGGILEALGRLFKSNVHLYVYPRKQETADGSGLLRAGNLNVPNHLRHLHRHLLENGMVLPIEDFDESVLEILARDARQAIRAGDAIWEAMVPSAAAEVIRQRRLFAE